MTDSPEAPESLNNLQGQLLKTIEPREIFNSGEYFYFSVDHKGLFSKPSGDYIVAPSFCLFKFWLLVYLLILLNCVKFDFAQFSNFKNKQVAKV